MSKRKSRARVQPSPPPMPEAVVMPPPEQAGAFDARRLEVNGPKVAVRRAPSLLHTLWNRSLVTRTQVEAGERFHEDHRMVWGSQGSDSCVLKVGGQVHETTQAAERTVRARARMDMVLRRVGPGTYALLRQVVVYEEPLGGSGRGDVYLRLRVGLDVTAAVYGVPEYAA
jgi:hypothetical protein